MRTFLSTSSFPNELVQPFVSVAHVFRPRLHSYPYSSRSSPNTLAAMEDCLRYATTVVNWRQIALLAAAKPTSSILHSRIRLTNRVHYPTQLTKQSPSQRANNTNTRGYACSRVLTTQASISLRQFYSNIISNRFEYYYITLAPPCRLCSALEINLSSYPTT